MTYVVEASDKLVAAADDWAEARMTSREEALRVKAEQALLEVEHLIANETAVDFEVDDRTIRYDPSSDAEAFLTERAEMANTDVETVLWLYVELFTDVFSDEDVTRPPNAPPTE